MPARFAADAMLGRLARWLRVLGFDTTYDPAIDDHLLVRHADDEGRILLTRDRHLLRDLRPAHAHEVRQDAPLEQLRELVKALALPPPRAMFTRCILCNTPLAVSHRAAPQWTDGPVLECTTCGRTYWHGSHVRRMRAALERALPGWSPS